MSNDIIELYNIYKNNINLVDNFYDIELGKVLSDRIWKMIKSKKSSIYIRIIYNIFFEQYIMTDDKNNKSDNIVIIVNDFNKTREDHLMIFDNACTLINDYNKIVLKKTKKINIIKVFKHLKVVKKYYKEFSFLPIRYQRLYLSSMMCLVDDLYNMIHIGKLLENKKNMLVFQDCDVVSNMFVQLMKKQGGLTVELQHGQWLYRNEPYDDYLNIANFTADYILVWNEFTKQQFINAGYEDKRIVVAGSTKYLYDFQSKLENKKKVGMFGVVLDTPAYTYSEEYNKRLLDIAEKLAIKLNQKYYIKIHPFDIKEKYDRYIKSFNCAGCVDRTATMKEYADLVDFSLGHTTGASVDLMILKSFVFLYKTDISYPLITNKLYEFRSIEELQASVEYILGNWNECLEEYEKIRSVYYTENALEMHKNFFDKTFN